MGFSKWGFGALGTAFRPSKGGHLNDWNLILEDKYDKVIEHLTLPCTQQIFPLQNEFICMHSASYGVVMMGFEICIWGILVTVHYPRLVQAIDLPVLQRSQGVGLLW